MKYYLTLLVIGCFLHQAAAQNKIQGQLIDVSTQKPVAYVNIGIQGTHSGTVSNDQGNFILELKEGSNTLLFSHVSYHSKKQTITDVEQTLLIELEPISHIFLPVEIREKTLKREVVLGVRNTKGRGKSVGFGNAQLGAELGALIPIDKETLVKKVHFVLNHAKGDSLLMRLNIYDYSNKVIGEKVLHYNVMIKEKQRKGTYEIDVEKYQILLKNDVLVSLEWLKDFDVTGNSTITFDTKKSKKLKGIYVRYSHSSEFIKLPQEKNHKPCIYIIGKQSAD